MLFRRRSAMTSSGAKHGANSYSALADARQSDDDGGVESPATASSALKDERPYLRQPLIWIDLEMTGTSCSRAGMCVSFFSVDAVAVTHTSPPPPSCAGLDVQNDSILQIACVITDGSLKTVIEGEEIVIHQSEEVLAGMNEWCVTHHGASGLTQAVRDSAISLAEAEHTILAFIQRHVNEPGIAQIAGNSVHVDVSFMRQHMPKIIDYAHYRIVDVSTIGELARRWYPKQQHRMPKKKNAHTAMSDIMESIEQLRYYRQSIFR